MVSEMCIRDSQVPVETIDGRVIGDGQAGPLTLKIRTLYFELIKKVSQ